MSRWTASEIPDQTARIAVITGANTGLGFATAKALALRGGSVVIACRDTARAQRAARLIGCDTSYIRADLASLASVREAAAELRSRFARIDLLVNNAGVMTNGESSTDDGFELQFGVSHLGHFALTGLLLDLMIHVPARVWSRLAVPLIGQSAEMGEGLAGLPGGDSGLEVHDQGLAPVGTANRAGAEFDGVTRVVLPCPASSVASGVRAACHGPAVPRPAGVLVSCQTCSLALSDPRGRR